MARDRPAYPSIDLITLCSCRGGNHAWPDAQAVRSIDRALAVYEKPVVWRKLQHRAMTRDFSWDYSARRFLAIYHELAPAAALVRAERAAEPKPERRPEALVEPERKRASAA